MAGRLPGSLPTPDVSVPDVPTPELPRPDVPRPGTRTLLALGGAVGAGGAATVGGLALGRRRFARRATERVDELVAAAERPATGPVTEADLADLPAPVRRYLATVLPAGRRHARTARLRQTGELQLRGKWRPFTAEQHVAVTPPGFVWDAQVSLLPGVSARVLDSYHDGAGALQARALSAVPVASASPGPELDEAELQRYLAECVWVPTALLPAAGVEWERVGDDAARATLDDGGTTASVTFHFDGNDFVERVHADGRYRREDDDHAPWTCSLEEYERRAGVYVPTTAEVAWDRPFGDGPYWRASVERVAYDVASPLAAAEEDGEEGSDDGLDGVGDDDPDGIGWDDLDSVDDDP